MILVSTGMNASDTVCVLPFVAMHVNPLGGLRPCCMFDNQAIENYFSDYPAWRERGLADLKHNLLEGRRDPRCQVCWQQEDSGAPSHRQRHNDIYPQDVDTIMNSTDGAANLPLRMLHLDFDNLCNLRCIMCSPSLSSSLQTEIAGNREAWQMWQPDIMRVSQPWHESERFNQLLEEMHTVEEIFVTGGEPLMNPGLLRMLDTVDMSQKILTVTTNGTRVNDHIMELLSRPRAIHVMISLEGVGAHNDYIRAGSDWNLIQNNIKRLRTLTNWRYDGLGINHTLQITSAWTLPGLIRWCLEMGLDLTINPLINPSQLHVSGMRDQWRLALIEQLREIQDGFVVNGSKSRPWIDSTIRYLEQIRHDPAVTARFFAYVDMLDQLRSTDFHKTFMIGPQDFWGPDFLKTS